MRWTCTTSNRRVAGMAVEQEGAQDVPAELLPITVHKYAPRPPVPTVPLRTTATWARARRFTDLSAVARAG
jgi:hypothetical protein